MPAKTSGVEKTNIDAIRSARKTRVEVRRCSSGSRGCRGRSRPGPPATAPQPSRRSPRVTAQIPQRGRDDADEDRPDDRARLDRRDREEAGDDAEEHADASDVSGRGDRRAQPTPRPVDACRRRARRAAGAELPARAPDVEDEHVGADEEHDQPLDHVGEVAGELRVDHARLQAVRRPEEQRAEEQRARGRRRPRCCGRAARPRSRGSRPPTPGCRRRRSGRGSRACRARPRGRRTRPRSPSRGSGSS